MEYLQALVGGLLIGFAAVLLLALNGRIAGISGIFAVVFSSVRAERSWRIVFLLGLILGGTAWQLWQPQPSASSASYGQLIVAGLMVGFGSVYGSGCTSGHGVCGLARFSVRSLAALLTFMAAGIATVYLVGL
ncbi:MAG: putative membrane protein YedE/YeeE [Pseudomonadales bacterium]|jgi:uncharacterized membrane protein YedE/YeeE